ncbi:Carboxypeptidase [Mycena kentingensis (nom. inval.)]|nr:Carboxypeptidase [Mycena kentingensis (nom. inval.)]
MKVSAVILALAAPPLVIASQQAFSTSQNAFTTFTNAAFPGYAVRIKETTGFCDSSVKSYCGYIDFQARHLFFYYFESRGTPAEDDVMLWLNGGPGGSSALGLFMELGPCTVVSENQTEFNPYSWTTNANMIFLEQPVGVGFSYAEYGQSIDTTEAAAKDVAAFLSIFFEAMGLQGRPFHIAGESFGGRYVPLFASEVYDQNKRMEKPINLVSAIIGKFRLTATVELTLFKYCSCFTSYYDIQCTITRPNVPPIQSIGFTLLPRCQNALQKHCRDTFDLIDCEAAVSFCGVFGTLFDETGRNAYDMRTKCVGEVRDTLCYPITKEIAEYLNSPATREILGVPPAPSFPNITMANFTVNQAFAASGDIMRSSTAHIAALLDRDVRVLLFAGTTDVACNYIGVERTALKLQWHGQTEFAAQPLRALVLDGVAAGDFREFGGLTFASVWDAGHMVRAFFFDF